jgi:hypothetical protein
MLLYTGTCFAVAPKVVKTIPENSDMNVKPGMVKVRIFFDQDMTQGNNYSITGGGENFPKIIGKPQWSGNRVIFFTARLQPNHEYEFGINSPSYKGFKNIRGEPAEIYSVYFKTTGGEGAVNDANGQSEQLIQEQNKAAIEELKEAIRKQYSYYDLKKVDWDAEFAQYEKRMVNAKTPEEFARVAGQVLAKAKDKHIWLTVDDKHIPAYVNPVTPNADFRLLPRLVPNFKKHNTIVCTGQFPDGIGYILIDSWSAKDENEFEPLYAALKDFANAPGLIIDVRGNSGGSETIAQKFAGCFVDKNVVYAKHVYIEPDKTGGFSDVRERSLQPTENGPRYRGKIAVLTGPVVISSCESFVLMMKQVPGCLIIGEPTQGSSGNPKPHTLSNGVTVYLPSWKDLLLDGTCLEGKGIQPDILVKMSSDKDSAQDDVLEAAIKALRKK